jgi:Mg2+/Co2+ transporter CorB
MENAFAALISIVLGLISVFLGARYRQLKQLLKTVVAAAEDDAVSEEEFHEIVAEAKKLLEG